MAATTTEKVDMKEAVLDSLLHAQGAYLYADAMIAAREAKP